MADCREVALPIYKLYVVSVIEQHKPIPPIPEFVLKVINEGLGSIDDIGGFLGLEQPVVEDALVELMRSDDVHLTAPPDRASRNSRLAPKGGARLEKSQLVVRQETTLPVHFDGLLRRVTSLGRSSFLTAKEVRDSGAMEIPPFPAKSPELEDLKLGELDQLFSRQFPDGEDKRRQKTRLLALKSLARRERFYQPAFALAYRAIDSDEVQVAFEIDGRLSQEHEEAFARGDGPRRLGIVQSITTTRAERLLAQVLGRDVINEAQPSEELEEAKEEAGCAAAELEAAHEKLKSAESAEQRKSAEQAAQAAAQRLAVSQAALAQHTTRHLGVFEHPRLLQQALQDSKQRLLIISPWITPEVVDAGFLLRLEALLQRGVRVYIGYGLGNVAEDKEGQKRVVAHLEKLVAKCDGFRITRMGDTHAKVLISDQNFGVVTSFNWLSFRGTQNRTFRDERGIYFSKRDLIDNLFNDYLSRFA